MCNYIHKSFFLSFYSVAVRVQFQPLTSCIIDSIMSCSIIMQAKSTQELFLAFFQQEFKDPLSLSPVYCWLSNHPCFSKVPCHLSSAVLTTVCVDAAIVQESNPEVVQHSWLVEKAESCQIILALQYVGIPQRWEIRGRAHWVTDFLSLKAEVRSLGCKTSLRKGFWTEAIISKLSIWFYLQSVKQYCISHFHLRAVAADASLQACSPGEAGLKPRQHLGQEPTHLPPKKGTDCHRCVKHRLSEKKKKSAG